MALAFLSDGAGAQCHLLAHHLAGRHDVHVITRASASPDDPEVPAGVTLHRVSPARDPARNRAAAAPGGRLSFWKACRAADAAVYFVRGAGFAAFVAWLHARTHRRRVVFHWASDGDLRGLALRGFPGTRPLYRLARRHADAQLCQTEHQLSLLPRRERRRATILPDSLDTRVPWRVAGGDEVLWVGPIDAEATRPDLFLGLAAALPHRRFRMVGELRGNAAFQEGFRARAASLPNVAVPGLVPRAALPGQYARARVLVNVSDHEGFPTTFLEACASGVPVVSLNADPNGILARQGAGLFLQGDRSGLKAAVERMFGDAAWRKARAACAAVARRHSPAVAAQRVADLAARLVR